MKEFKFDAYAGNKREPPSMWELKWARLKRRFIRVFNWGLGMDYYRGYAKNPLRQPLVNDKEEKVMQVKTVTPLARALNQMVIHGPIATDMFDCIYCSGSYEDDKETKLIHNEDCPWLNGVKALEDFQEICPHTIPEYVEENDPSDRIPGRYCSLCGKFQAKTISTHRL